MKIETAKISDDIEIEYSFSGAQNEDTLLFVHGLGSNLRQFEMPNAGHFANMEKPSKFNDILGRFLLKQSIMKYL